MDQEPEKPELTGERFVPTFMKTVTSRNEDDGTVTYKDAPTKAEARLNQPLMHALRSNPNQSSLQDVEPTSWLISQHQAMWAERVDRGMTELGDNPYSDNWIDNPFNWTALELSAINRGADVGVLIEFEAAGALYDEAVVAFDKNQTDLAMGRAQIEIQFKTSEPWMEFDEMTDGKLPDGFLDGLALSFPRMMEQKELNQFISEFGVEVRGNPDMLDDKAKMNDLLGRMVIRIQQIAGQAKKKREIRDRGFGSSFSDLFQGIVDPLLGPGINFDDEGILSGLEGVFQPRESFEKRLPWASGGMPGPLSIT